MRRIRRHLTYANIAATLALALALGGTSAYAATLITSRMIKNGTIQSIDIHNGTIRPVDLAPGTRSLVYSNVATVYKLSIYSQRVESEPFQTVDSLYIPKPGNYVLLASLQIANYDTTASQFECRLLPGDGGTYDDKQLGLSTVSGTSFVMPMTLQLTHHYSAAATALVQCVNVEYDLTKEPEVQNITLTAMRVASVTNPTAP